MGKSKTKATKQVDAIVTRNELAGKLDRLRIDSEEAQAAIDVVNKSLGDLDVQNALEACADDWQIRDHVEKAEAAASMMLSVAEDLRTARLKLLGADAKTIPEA